MQANAACIEKIVKLEQLNCVKTAKEFSEFNSFLCANNNRDFSAQYQTYLKHQKDWTDTFDKFKVAASQSEKQYLKLKLDSIQRDWRIYGYRNEVEYMMALVNSAEHQCRAK